MGANTTANRPIVNTRDEPHADRERFRRLHVIVGDSNMCEVAGLLKAGTTRLLLRMLEDNTVNLDFTLAQPVRELVEVSHDLSLSKPLELEGGRTITALEIQREFLAAAEEYCAVQERCDEEDNLVLGQWRRVLDKLAEDPMQLSGALDWVTKLSLLKRYIDRKGLNWRHPRVRRIDILYHDIRPERGLFHILEREGKVERVLDGDERVKYFVHNPPEDTRAWFRSHCIRRFGDAVAEANWDILSFDTGDARLKRISLGDPTKGTKELLEATLEASGSATELLQNLLG